jgi:broad specificity phosphatase PhoE
MAKIYLVRHGETDWNRDHRILGRTQTPLNPDGIVQVQKLAHEIAKIKVSEIYSSPLRRTFQTAEILGEALGLHPLPEPRMIEADIGNWEGRYWHELDGNPIREQYYSDPQTARPPGGETLEEVQQRAVASTDELNRWNPGGSFLIVSHADVIRSVLAHYIGIDLKSIRKFRIPHASLSLISLDSAETAIHFINLIPSSSGPNN